MNRIKSATKMCPKNNDLGRKTKDNLGWKRTWFLALIMMFIVHTGAKVKFESKNAKLQNFNSKTQI